MSFEEPVDAKVDLTEEQVLEAEKKAKKEAKAEAAKLEKAAREAKKSERLAARQAQEAAKKAEYVKDPNDPSAAFFGDMDMIRSQCDPEDRFTKKYIAVKDITDAHVGTQIRIRGRINNSRAKGNMCFVVVREGYASVQCVLFVGDKISKGMVQYVSKLSKESIVEIIADVTKPSAAIDGCSQQVELQVAEFWCVNKSVPILPFQLEDASRKVLN